MTLIETFTDYVVNRKSLKEYVEVRKSMNERGEFNDASLLQAQENLDRLKKENSKTLENMYKTLDEVFERDMGHHVEYPIDFIRIVLSIGQHGVTPEQACQEYQNILEHHFHDA